MASRSQRSVGAVPMGASPIPTVGGMEGSSVTAAINVTPMVDVMLVLLIIFMVITPVLAAYEATLPEAQFVVPEPDDDVVTMGIDAAGIFYVENEPIARDQLAQRLQQIYYDRPGDHLLFLRADREVGYSVVLDAIESARAAGVRTIGAITTPLPDERSAAGTSPPAENGALAAAGGR